ncbi:helix-turn-helix domain-containing protein [Salininema proteolyticum]
MAGNPELGEQLRATRNEAALTQADMAKRTGYSVTHVTNMECGRRSIPDDVLLAYEEAHRERTDMRRRTVALGGAAMLIAPEAASRILTRGFDALLGSTPDNDDWNEHLYRLGEDYMTSGASVVQSTLAADLSVLQHAVDAPEMWAVVAKELVVFGKTTKGPADAIRWYRKAAVAAKRSGDRDTQIWVAGRAALALGYEGAATPTALTFARQAIELSNGAPSAGLLNALMGYTHALATSGHHREAREAWDETQRVYDAVSPTDEITDFNYPWWRFAVVGSLLHARLGDPKAEQWQGEIAAHRPANMVRFETHAELHKALMIAKGGDKEGGLTYGKTALEALPEDKRSQSLYLMLDEIRGV